MGLRQAFGRRRGANDESGDGRGRRVAEPPAHRHQADPVTGELMRVTDAGSGADRYYTPPRAERRARTAGPAEPPLPDTEASEAAPRTPTGFPAPAGSPVPPARILRPRPPTAPPPPPPASAPSAPAHVAGGLIVGHAERRRAPTITPTFYAAAPKPYDRSEMRRAFDLVADRADKLVRTFYAELFVALGDDALRMFPSSMVAQREDFGRALVQWVVTDSPDSMTAHLAQLGADHRKFDVQPAHYDLVGTALISAWKNLAGDAWTPRMESVVRASYTRLASIMIDGAAANQDEPKSWGATVIAHERVLPDFAVLRLQPDAPYPYRPGQYLTIEVGSHRRQWRQMSIASAPRPDNTFELQVRSVNATGVSAALVMHTRIGDRVRLGPPRGNDLVIEPGTVDNGLLCVCSGTGAAPVSAVVESVMNWPDYPPLHAFVGVRTAGDLYPVDQLSRLVRSSARADQVHVHGVVSDDPAYTGLRGRVEDVVPELKDWAQLGFDVLVSGPNLMMATTINELIDRGVPSRRIHFDQYEASG